MSLIPLVVAIIQLITTCIKLYMYIDAKKRDEDKKNNRH